MKKLFILLSVTTSLLAGCATNNQWPGVTKTAAFIATTASLAENPGSRPEIELAENIVCSVAASPNASPQALVTALDASGPWKPLTRALIVSLVLVANQAVNANTNFPAAIYLQAVCDGMTLAAMTTATGGAASLKPADPRWPQVR